MLSITKNNVKSLIEEYFQKYSAELDTNSKLYIAERKYIDQHLDRYFEILKLIPFSPKLKILEPGIAYGHLAYLVRRFFGHDVCAIDIDREEIPLWRKRYQAEHITFKICNLIKNGIPFPNHYFDIVLFCEVLEHLPIHPIIIFSKE
jgi:2-polyprenyl-3-methyl-5-hydroxy-6-metoxy-1,4-benzoquinol methylase